MKTKRVIALLFALMLAFCAALPAFAEGERSQVEGYSVSAPGGRITKGAVVTITVKVKANHTFEKYETVSVLFNNSDSFVREETDGGVVLDTEDHFTVTFTNVKYTGQGNLLTFTVHYNGNDKLNGTGLDSEWLTVPIRECSGEGEPQTEGPKSEGVKTEPPVKTNAVPVIQINRENRQTPVNAGESFKLNVLLANAAPAAATNAVVYLTPGAGLTLEENKATKTVGTVPANGVATVPVALKAANPLQMSQLTLGVALKYQYTTADGKVAEGTVEEKILIPATPTKTTQTKADISVPTLVVTQYEYGGSSVTAGKAFQLTVSFRNTSKTTAAENVSMIINTSENLNLTASSNTFHFDSIKPNETKKQSIEMIVPANTALSSAKANLSFRYEYTANGARSSGTANESLSMPVYLPDSFSLTEPGAIVATQATEVNLSIPYDNHGKGAVNNVEAKIEFGGLGDATCEQPTRTLGRVDAGRTGSIDFTFTPNVVGELKLSVTVTYEDEMNEPRIVTMPLVMTVDEPEPNNYSPGEDGPYSEGRRTLSKSAIGAIVIGSVAIIVVIVSAAITLKRRREFYEWQAGFNWNDDNMRE